MQTYFLFLFGGFTFWCTSLGLAYTFGKDEGYRTAMNWRRVNLTRRWDGDQ